MKSLITALLVFGLLSCGSDKKSDHQPLNGDQKAQFSTTLDSFGRVLTSAEVADKKKRGIRNALYADAKSNQMGQAIHQANCDVSVKIPQNSDFSSTGNQSQKIELSASAKGERCPISLDYNFTLDVDVQAYSHARMTATFKANYEVKDQTYRTYNDIIAFNFDGSLGLEAERNKLTANGEVKGTLNSVTKGNLELSAKSDGEVSGDNNDFSGEVRHSLAIKYPEFVAELKVIETYENAKSVSDKKVEYLLNGESISKKEFETYLRKIFSGGTVAQFHGFTALLAAAH